MQQQWFAEAFHLLRKSESGIRIHLGLGFVSATCMGGVQSEPKLPLFTQEAVK